MTKLHALCCPSSTILMHLVGYSCWFWCPVAALKKEVYISGTRGTRAEEAFRFLWWMRIFKVAQRYQEDRPGSHLLGKYVCSFSSIRYMGKALCWLSLWEIPERIKYRKKAFPGCWCRHQYAGNPSFLLHLLPFSCLTPSLLTIAQEMNSILRLHPPNHSGSIPLKLCTQTSYPTISLFLLGPCLRGKAWLTGRSHAALAGATWPCSHSLWTALEEEFEEAA